MATMRIILEGGKCAGNGVNKILTITLMTVNSHINVPIVVAFIRCMQDLVKHQNNIPYYEAHKLVVGSKTTTYSQAVQLNKTPYKYETIVKTLIQLEPDIWESFINKIKASLDTTRAADASTTSVDLVENKEESSAQTQV